ncbi:MAG: alpha/beta fold hydrolase [Actinomycetes bacterium]
MSTFVLLHGVPGSPATWRHVAAHLEPRHVVLRPALVGFAGQPLAADADGLLAPAQAEHVLRELDAAGVDRAVVVGHDFGGPVAAHLWRLAPQRVEALALLSTNAFPDTPVPFPLSTVRWPVIARLASAALFSAPSLAGMALVGTGRPWRMPDVRAAVGGRRQRRAIATVFGESLRRLTELYAPVQLALSTVTVPTHVAWGTRDPFFSVELGRRTAALVPGATFSVHDGAGHYLPEERPAEVARELEALAVLSARGPRARGRAATA